MSNEHLTEAGRQLGYAFAEFILKVGKPTAIGGPAVPIDEVDKKLGWDKLRWDEKGERPAPVPRPGVGSTEAESDPAAEPTITVNNPVLADLKELARLLQVEQKVKSAAYSYGPTKRPPFDPELNAQKGIQGHLSTVTGHLNALAREIETIENMPDRIHATNALRAVRRTFERAYGSTDE